MAGFKRKVFYVGGFDPRGARFYHALAAEQVARFAQLTGEPASVSPRRRAGAFRTDWSILNSTHDVSTEYSFLRWDDIVRKAWIRSPFALAARAWRAYRAYIAHLDFETGKRLGKGPLITLFYPPILSIALPLLLTLIIGGLAAIWLPGSVAFAIGLVAAILISAPLLKKWHAPWLLRFFVFNSELSGGEADPEIEARLDNFAEEICASLDQDWDEIILLTHSNGSILSVPLMVRVLERRGDQMPPNFTLVTMGHCIPLVACRRDATHFHDQLRRLATADFRWVDIGSPPDGAAYFGVNPMAIVAPDPRPRMDLLSPRFHLFYNPETYHKGYANKYEIHFDYLRMGDRRSPLDFPSLMTAARPIDASVAEFRAI
ncbi:hypothetical protein SAMN05428950_101599 [Sphingomonas sp. OV641]|uniref:hypothetical protein n=1 Tax=Sphingomonas sp. OV641 TaxID=1881068 RepID=UPI0008BA14EB|nr:hypothetical protein [Sphingomonas sp. OV641]SEI92948.1 hypothetical protein SAMN05428950_101599 [Sphingomonas sp. OV641]